MGSSPRVWGQVDVNTVSQTVAGIIPTRMGTSKKCILSLRPSRDHPHAYGDKFISIGVFCALIGSSPRVWGQDSFQKLFCVVIRIIPTRMGTRSLSLILPFSSRDHPHAYGDKKFTLKNCCFCPGSSPRVWGQEIWQQLVCSNTGIIPTRMGTSPAL